MSKVEKPKNAPDPWYANAGMSEWNYDWDEYMVRLKRGNEYVMIYMNQKTEATWYTIGGIN